MIKLLIGNKRSYVYVLMSNVRKILTGQHQELQTKRY